MDILILNGPNLNLQGKREVEVYGTITFENYLESLYKKYTTVKIDYFQSNIEGELINKIQEYGFKSDGIVLNAGGYTHTSVAIRDAIKAVSCPVIEVHISNPASREEFRNVSYLTAVCEGSISGLGLNSYELALQALLLIQGE